MEDGLPGHPMRRRMRLVQGAWVLRLPADLVADAEAGILAAASPALSSRGRKLVLDFSTVTYADSAGVGILVVLVQRARQMEIPLILAAVGRQPRLVLDRVGFLRLVPVYPTVEEAVEG